MVVTDNYCFPLNVDLEVIFKSKITKKSEREMNKITLSSKCKHVEELKPNRIPCHKERLYY